MINNATLVSDLHQNVYALSHVIHTLMMDRVFWMVWDNALRIQKFAKCVIGMCNRGWYFQLLALRKCECTTSKIWEQYLPKTLFHSLLSKCSQFSRPVSRIRYRLLVLVPMSFA